MSYKAAYIRLLGKMENALEKVEELKEEIVTAQLEAEALVLEDDEEEQEEHPTEQTEEPGD